jgi:hypothetical protein
MTKAKRKAEETIPNKTISTKSKIKSAEEIQEDVSRLKRLLAEEEVRLASAQKAGNNIEIIRSKELINKMKKGAGCSWSSYKCIV